MLSVRAELEFHRPASLQELERLLGGLSAARKEFRFLAGGTDLIPGLKRRQQGPLDLISLREIPELQGIGRIPSDPQRIRIGLGTTLTGVHESPLLAELLPGLARAAGEVAGPQIRNKASVGGNILVDNRCVYINQSDESRGSFGSCFKAGGDVCHLVPTATRESLPLCRARFSSDLAPVLMALNAELLSWRGGEQKRRPLRELYRPEGMCSAALAPGELGLQLEISLKEAPRVDYRKLRIRQAIDFPSVGVAVARRRCPEGTEWSVAVTGVNPAPIFLRELTEKAGPCPEPLLDAFAASATKEAVALKQDFFPPPYRKKMISVFIRRAAAACAVQPG